MHIVIESFVPQSCRLSWCRCRPLLRSLLRQVLLFVVTVQVLEFVNFYILCPT
ncbi:hypothetical protein M6B38_307425 [Iris pallida]|uniref:Uncharacterized protein n=1 Tax=Iris pallida TaxID=29817 RepID=A0AAX6HK48_IRIPA|nr:hypothetical protein M6B38_199475 [Iris pallida]KAJ6835314.1 hypothetical protein M6B38_124540 [Iris pallida]KAJ6841123.1 hypothetical protein M6B38_307425 [Iris pallida]